MTLYSVEVYTSIGLEDVDIVAYDDYLYLGECSSQAAEGIRQLLTPEHLETYEGITVVWMPGKETRLYYDLKED